MNSLAVWCSTTQTDRFSLLDVTKAGASPSWFNADRHKRASLFRSSRSCFQVCSKSRGVLNDVIRRQHNHRRGVITDRDPTRPKRDRRRRIPFRRLSHNVFLRQIAATARAPRLPVRCWSKSECVRAGSIHLNAPPFVREAFSSATRRRSCFGRARRLSGQNRSPLPPARISA